MRTPPGLSLGRSYPAVFCSLWSGESVRRSVALGGVVAVVLLFAFTSQTHAASAAVENQLTSLTISTFLGALAFVAMIGSVMSATRWKRMRHRQIIGATRAVPPNAGAQRILIDVRMAGLTGTPASRADFEVEPTVAYCRMLAERMGGTLRVENGYAAFEAPFTIQAIEQHDAPCSDLSDEQKSGSIVPPFSARQTSSKEPFDRSYLDALVKEGINLQTFLRGWHQAMQDDLACMHARRNDYQVAMRSALHKLSGATGLVGAKSLATALREAGAASTELESCTINALTTRLQTLMTQLDEVAKTSGGDRR